MDLLGNMKTTSGRGETGETTNHTARLQDGKKNSNEIERKGKSCRACGETHHLEKCKVFIGWSFEKKWEAAKRFGVCFRCLDYDHLGHQCPKRSEGTTYGCYS